MAIISKSLQGVLWSSPVDKLDIDKNKVYIIHQVLMYGDFSHIRWLFDTYSKKQVKDVFLKKPQKIYTKPSLNYISKFVLGIDSDQFSSDKYINAVH